MLGPIIEGSIEKTFLLIRQTQPFLKRFSERIIFEDFQKNVVRKSFALNVEVKNLDSANNEADETPRPHISAVRAN